MRLLTYQLTACVPLTAATAWSAAVLSAQGRPKENQATRERVLKVLDSCPENAKRR